MKQNDDGVHFRHCFQGEHINTCKYGEDEICPAKPKIINKPEWMPGHPCITCELKPRDPTCFGCMSLMLYEERCETQKKLLEYLIVHPPDFCYYSDNYSYTKTLESMLKQLEENNGYCL